MRVPQLQSCCCGCTLETGSLILGWLQLVGGVLFIISGIVGLVGGGSEHLGPTAYASTIFYGVIQLILALVLLIGVKRRLAKYVHWWVSVMTICLILFAVGAVVEVISQLINGNISEGISALVGAIIGILIEVYFILVVNSFKREISSEGNAA